MSLKGEIKVFWTFYILGWFVEYQKRLVYTRDLLQTAEFGFGIYICLTNFISAESKGKNS